MQLEILRLGVIGELAAHPLEQTADREIELFGLHDARLDLGNVEQRIEHARHPAERRVEP